MEAQGSTDQTNEETRSQMAQTNNSGLRSLLRENIFVILSRPSNPENIGLVARAMKNTGFKHLRIILDKSLPNQAFRTAVHAEDLLKNAGIYSQLSEATKDLSVVFAASARYRKNFPSLSFNEAAEKMASFSSEVKVGLVFGTERTGLVSRELRHSNYRFLIPQAESQPSYNLASAVLLTLFQLFSRGKPVMRRKETKPKPISRSEQEECINLIVKKLEKINFIHQGNREHVVNMLYDLFGRLVMKERDRNLLLAVFSKGISEKKPDE